MSFGKKKNNNDKKVAAALQPSNFYTPFGNLENGRYTPIENSEQMQMRGVTDSALLNVLQGIPTSFNVNEAFHNPFYQTVSSLYKQPLSLQQQQDKRELRNSLSASNQLGSSYDAYQHDLLARRYTDAYQQVDNQARLASADAYNQSLTNALSTLTALRNERNAALNATFLPLQYGLNYQQAISPLQQTLGNYYASRPVSSGGNFIQDYVLPSTQLALQAAPYLF